MFTKVQNSNPKFLQLSLVSVLIGPFDLHALILNIFGLWPREGYIHTNTCFSWRNARICAMRTSHSRLNSSDSLLPLSMTSFNVSSSTLICARSVQNQSAYTSGNTGPTSPIVPLLSMVAKSAIASIFGWFLML